MLKNRDSSNMSQTFGNFVEDESSSPEYLVIGFSSNSIPLKQLWRNNGLSASFVADFLIPFFPVVEDEPDALKQRNKVIGAVRYITNELLENAMKFSDETSQYPISIKLDLRRDRLVFRTTNAIEPQQISSFQALIQDLLSCDPNERFIYQLEKNTQEGCSSSGLGLLTIMNDYAGILGWKFETIQQDLPIATVTTTVQLPL
ncbi:slr1658 superfamily regulator [Scytonema sp. PRP1]|uniref:slr1658 superfamily regulator n=1 Tax=Scytonema sp. PRP1 TaxID=3120513 RepID=UPI00300CCEB9